MIGKYSTQEKLNDSWINKSWWLVLKQISLLYKTLLLVRPLQSNSKYRAVQLCKLISFENEIIVKNMNSFQREELYHKGYFDHQFWCENER